MKLWTYLLALAAVTAQAGEMCTLRTAGDLKAKPFLDASKVADLASTVPLEIVARRGAWMQVKTPTGQIGWVKLLSVNITAAAGTGVSAGSGLLSLASALRTGSTGATATTGVKGLDQENLETATPNPGELAKLESFTVTPVDAAAFAEQGHLVAQKDIPYLPVPNDQNH